MFYFKSAKSFLIVFIQFLSIAVIIFSGKFFPENLIILIIFALFILTGFIAIIQMNRYFHAAPELKPGASLLNRGVYRYIRHPMYTSVLGACISLLISDFNITRFVFYIILVSDLLYKINYEEKLLKNNFPEYSSYIKKTKKLIPFIY